MDLIRALVALHPREWRRRYGEEFAALLEDTRLTRSAVINVATHAAKLQIRAHTEGALMVAALAVSTISRITAHNAGFAVNILWAPTTALRALTLLGAVGPFVGLTVRCWVRRRVSEGVRHRARRN
jgi:hypothetical protein